jgi:hypothetical protein
VAGCIQNLKPWPKGVSGNPAGRPKNDISVEIARAVFENNPEAIYQGMVRALKKGNARVFKVLADRAYGKVKEQVEFGLGDDLSAMSNAELNARIIELTASLGFHLYDPSDLACLSDDELETLETIQRKIAAAGKDRIELMAKRQPMRCVMK